MARRARSQVVREYYVRLGRRISDLRRERGLTLRDCAQHLGLVPHTLYLYEVGSNACPVHVLIALAQVLDVPLGRIVRNI